MFQIQCRNLDGKSGREWANDIGGPITTVQDRGNQKYFNGFYSEKEAIEFIERLKIEDAVQYDWAFEYRVVELGDDCTCQQEGG